MRRHHCLYLWLGVLLWYASMPASAQVWHDITPPSPSDSVPMIQNRMSVWFGVAGVIGKSPLLGQFSRLGQINTGLIYGRRSERFEWEIQGILTRQFFDSRNVAHALGLYDKNNLSSADGITIVTNKRFIDGLSLSASGKFFFAMPRNNAVSVFVRGYAGLHFLNHHDFNITVVNRNPRVDTTLYVRGESSIFPFVGIVPGVEFRHKWIGVFFETYGVRFYPGRGLHIDIANVGISVFF